MILMFYLTIHSLTTTAVAQWVRESASKAEGRVFESQARQT